MADTVLTDLKIHDFDSLAQMSQYESEIGDNDLVFTPDISCRLPLLAPMFFDHITNDMSWLRADTFSWQSGDAYKAAYEHLNSDFFNSQDLEHLKSDIIGDIEIVYFQADDGHKICLPDQEEDIAALYNQTGAADYYILDTENKQFKLPRNQKRRLIRAFNDGNTWYNLYSDGWVEQGGFVAPTSADSTAMTFPIEFANAKWTMTANPVDASTTQIYTISFNNRTTTGCTLYRGGNVRGFTTVWRACGYAAESEYAGAGVEYEYYYVGNFEQSAIEQTAGITAETLNGKVDLPTGKAQSDVDFVVESQTPTAANGYTWYRKYKSGWVEQGGRALVPVTNGLASSVVVMTLPVPITAPEQATLTYNGMGSAGYFANCEDVASVTTTTVTIGRWNNGSPAADERYYNWNLSGMSAQ